MLAKTQNPKPQRERRMMRRSLQFLSARRCFVSSSSSFRSLSFLSAHPKSPLPFLLNSPPLSSSSSSYLSGLVGFSLKPCLTIFPFLTLRFVNTESSEDTEDNQDDPFQGTSLFSRLSDFPIYDLLNLYVICWESLRSLIYKK